MTVPLDAKFSMFENRIKKVWKHIAKVATKQGIACFRFYDHDLPEFPFRMEWYDGAVYVSEYKRKHGMEDDEHALWVEQCKAVIADVLQISVELIYMKERKRLNHKDAQYEKEANTKIERIVKEQGLSFIINLSDYLDTGLFLDHRITRAYVKDQAKGKRVLNLFCYTGSFSVYAAAGGADLITSVDLSNTYINWTKRNLQYNKLYSADKHMLVQDDVMEWLKAAPKDYFDLVIVDPPTFSNSKRMQDIFDVQRDHVALLKLVLKTTKVEGTIIFSNNFKNFVLDEAAIPAFKIKDITKFTTPFDFVGKLHRHCFEITK
jgi:23S rRNA (cytosine1962-C5)-methyltransferase